MGQRSPQGEGEDAAAGVWCGGDWRRPASDVRILNVFGGRELPPFAWLAASAIGLCLAFSMFITVSTNFMVEELGIRAQ